MALSPKSYDLIQVGPLFDVVVRHHPRARQLMQNDPVWGGTLPSMSLKFLVDTGASHSFIDQRVVHDMQIEPTGFISNVRTATGEMPDAPGYLVELTMGAGVLNTMVIGLPTKGILASENPPYRGILGRSSLQNARFVYDGPAGTFEMRIRK